MGKIFSVGIAAAMIAPLMACGDNASRTSLSDEEAQQLEEAAEMLDSRAGESEEPAVGPTEIPAPFESE